jgi:Family of unknown function (DUF6489)
MKVNIEIECTLVEARQFFGLPNVEPMQAAVMQQLEQRMLADIERFSPEALIKTGSPWGRRVSNRCKTFFAEFSRRQGRRKIRRRFRWGGLVGDVKRDCRREASNLIVGVPGWERGVAALQEVRYGSFPGRLGTSKSGPL